MSLPNQTWRETTRIAGELRKDLHLVQAALQTDRVIITLDHRARLGFEGLEGRVESIRRLRWLDPAREHDEIYRWLKGGK